MKVEQAHVYEVSGAASDVQQAVNNGNLLSLLLLLLLPLRLSLSLLL